MVYVVAYDLRSPHDAGEDYERIAGGLKSLYPAWCHVEQSVWLVEAQETAAEVRDTIRRFLHDSDVLFVARLQGNWGSFNIGSRRADWLKSRAF